MSICSRLSLFLLPVLFLNVSPSYGAELSSLPEMGKSVQAAASGSKNDNSDPKKKKRCCTGGTGPTGPTGPCCTGPTGPAGEPAPGVFAYYNNPNPLGVPVTVADGAPVPFPVLDPSSSPGWGGAADGTVTIPSDGVYQTNVYFYVCGNNVAPAAGSCSARGQINQTINGVPQDPDALIPWPDGYVYSTSIKSYKAGDKVQWVFFSTPPGGFVKVNNAGQTISQMAQSA